jgi:hypothetical protein
MSCVHFLFLNQTVLHLGFVATVLVIFCTVFQIPRSGSVCFWTSWIRIRIHNYFVHPLWILILPSASKKTNKNLDFGCLVASCLFLLED